MSFVYNHTVSVSRAGSTVVTGLAISIQMLPSAHNTGFREEGLRLEKWRIYPDPSYVGTFAPGDILTDDTGRQFRLVAADASLLGWSLNAITEEVSAGATYPTHAIYLVEVAAGTTQDPNTGLPVPGATGYTLISPPPRVFLGGKTMMSAGGAPQRMGDAEVTNLSKAAWPTSRILAAQGFTIDAASGDFYRLLGGSLTESGPNTYSLLLERVSQPRP